MPEDLIGGYTGRWEEGLIFSFNGYITKIMSTNGNVNEILGHATFWMVRSEQITFNYA